VQSVSEQLDFRQLGLTSKQSILVDKIIKKYERQLHKLGVEQPNHSNYKFPIRESITENSVKLVNDTLRYKFPFDNRIILAVKEFKREAQGTVEWNGAERSWVIALTEYNLNWIVSFASANNAVIDPGVMELYNQILEAEKVPFSITLRVKDGTCYIENGPSSMVEYLENNVGFNNILALVDSAGICGYSIDNNIKEMITAEYGPAFIHFCKDRNIDFDPLKEGKDAIKKVISWAKEVNRFPICVVNPFPTTEDLNIYKEIFGEDEIQIVGNKLSIGIDPNAKLVYSNRVLTEWEGRLPLLITYANLHHGGNKRKFLNKAEKVVYYCSTLPRTYNE
jgi:hypothetical protein